MTNFVRRLDEALGEPVDPGVPEGFIGIGDLLPTIEKAMKNSSVVDITEDLKGVKERMYGGRNFSVKAGKGIIQIHHHRRPEGEEPEGEEQYAMLANRWIFRSGGNIEETSDPLKAARRISILIARPIDKYNLEFDSRDWFGP